MIFRNKKLEIPFIQGGMGVGVSMGNLAGNVANYGGVGVISTANTGFLSSEFAKNPFKANVDGLKQEILKAREIADGKGLIGINAMVATVQFEQMVKAAVDSGIDCIISGAGLPLNLPKLTKGTDVLMAPIVSSAKAATIISKFWDKKYQCMADFIVIEGAKAGGHLGFAAKELAENTTQSLETILINVKEAIKPFEEKYQRAVPIFVAGGLNTAEKVRDVLKLGADGVQVATRFLTTKECDATQGYKDVYIRSSSSDISIVQSPVGMEARAIVSPLIERLKAGRIPPSRCINCIHTCDPSKTPYCITDALIKAYNGDFENGLFFCDDDIDCLTEMTTVKAVMDELTVYMK